MKLVMLRSAGFNNVDLLAPDVLKLAVARVKRSFMLINTSRGRGIDTQAMIGGLKMGAMGQPGLDVYQEEDCLFVENLSGDVIQDDIFARLLTFPNVLVTRHRTSSQAKL